MTDLAKHYSLCPLCEQYIDSWEDTVLVEKLMELHQPITVTLTGTIELYCAECSTEKELQPYPCKIIDFINNFNAEEVLKNDSNT